MKKIVNERRIKHWQGYGSVDAKVLRNTPENMIIQVKGMHEYGLDCGAWDTDRVYEWLVKRFDPSRKPTDIKSVDIDDDYERQGNVDIEVCTYDIHFVDVDRFELAQEGKNDNPRFKMAESAITLKEIEKWYGKPTADALVEYCKKTKKSVDDVAGSDREWDRFEQDAKARKRSLGTLSKKFDDWVDAADMDGKRANKSAKRAKKGRFGDVYSAPTDFSTMQESKDDADVGYEMNFLTNAFLEKIGDCLKTDCGVTGNIEKYKFGPRIYFEHRGLGFYVEVKCCGKTED